jgi:chloramphenicol-sensitive protein RarD
VSSSAAKTGGEKIGICYGIAAYLWWGLAIFWFKAVAHVSPWEVVAHRIVWSSVLLIGFLAATGRLTFPAQILSDRRLLAILAITTCLLAHNWYVFVWAVAHDRILETSFAYYITPLINVLLGRVVLREKLRAVQVTSVMLAVLGVSILGMSYGRIPIVSLALAISLGLYGLLRKKISLDGTEGLAIETIIMAPAAMICILYLQRQGQLTFGHLDTATDLLLAAAGVITALPLIWFVNAAKRLRYATLGLMMYILPSITFLAAVFVFREPFGTVHLISFCCIWAALLLYSCESIRGARSPKAGKAASPVHIWRASCQELLVK